jgi:hypothetical protein
MNFDLNVINFTSMLVFVMTWIFAATFTYTRSTSLWEQTPMRRKKYLLMKHRVFFIIGLIPYVNMVLLAVWIPFLVWGILKEMASTMLAIVSNLFLPIDSEE